MLSATERGSTQSRPPLPSLEHIAVFLALISISILLSAAAVEPASVEPAEPLEGAEIHGLQVENQPHDILVSFNLQGAFTGEVKEQIESGLPVTFNHYVE